MQTHTDAVCLGAVVNETFFKPWVFQRLLRCDSILGIVDKDALQQIQELTVERGVGGNEVLEECEWICWN